ncbi:MAG: alpha/beta fold hydrolase [Planctomycetes bacterium]|nr:alpha/beta fold hydrolase [Planctomycetota bacterium]
MASTPRSKDIAVSRSRSCRRSGRSWRASGVVERTRFGSSGRLALLAAAAARRGRVRYLALALILVAASSVTAQVERFEIGLRLLALESTWRETTDAERRRAAVTTIDRAVRSFLELRLGEVALALDCARHRLLGDSDVPAWFDVLAIQPLQRVVSGETESLVFEIRPAYTAALAIPEGAWAEVRVGDDVPVRTPVPPEVASGARIAVSCANLRGDGVVRLRFGSGETVRRTWNDVVSRVADLDGRFDALDRRSRALARRDGLAGTYRGTARGLLLAIRRLRDGQVPELPIAVEGDLRRADRLLHALEQEAVPSRIDSTGDHWWVVQSKSGATPIRSWVPTAAREKRVPLVIAAHGLGGSEQLFFEGYGGGRVVELAQARDWIVVAPRVAILGGVSLDELAESVIQQFPVDPTRVYLIGHSMGAMKSVEAACRHPERFRAVAAIGGGGRVRPSEALRSLPFFVAAGEADFGLPMARVLDGALRRAGVTTRLRVFDDCEHMLVVGESLPSVFEFFDGLNDRESER